MEKNIWRNNGWIFIKPDPTKTLRNPGTRHMKQTTLKHIINRLLKSSNEKKNLKINKKEEKRYITCLGTKTKITADISEILQARNSEAMPLKNRKKKKKKNPT